MFELASKISYITNFAEHVSERSKDILFNYTFFALVKEGMMDQGLKHVTQFINEMR